MKRLFPYIWLVLSSALANQLLAQGTAFSYQGQLQNGGAPANGNYDFRFRLAEDPLGNNYAGNPYLTNDIPVVNGLFITTVDFGPGIFAGSNYWLEVDVRTNGAASYTDLTPLQAVTPTPYAIFANTASNLNGTVDSANLSGTYGNALTLNNAANQLSGNGSSLTALNASQLASGTVPQNRLPSSVVTNNATSVTLSGTFSGIGSGLTSLNASQLSSGTVPLARLPTSLLTNDQTAPVTFSNLTLNGRLNLPDTAAIYSGIAPLLFSDVNGNLFTGGGGGQALTGPANAGFGSATLDVLTSGSYNTAVGAGASGNLMSGSFNTSLGLDALQDITTASNNVALGAEALVFSGDLTGDGGSGNIAIGYEAGYNYDYDENNNILIGNLGVPFDEFMIRIGTPGVHTSASIAGVVTDVDGVQVGTNGTTMVLIQSGQATMPGSSTVETNFTVTFPHAFTATPKVIASLSGDPNFPNAADTFAMSIRAITTTNGFTINVVRVDTAGGWSQQLRVNWQAWQ